VGPPAAASRTRNALLRPLLLRHHPGHVHASSPCVGLRCPFGLGSKDARARTRGPPTSRVSPSPCIRHRWRAAFHGHAQYPAPRLQHGGKTPQLALALSSLQQSPCPTLEHLRAAAVARGETLKIIVPFSCARRRPTVHPCCVQRSLAQMRPLNHTFGRPPLPLSFLCRRCWANEWCWPAPMLVKPPCCQQTTAQSRRAPAIDHGCAVLQVEPMTGCSVGSQALEITRRALHMRWRTDKLPCNAYPSSGKTGPYLHRNCTAALLRLPPWRRPQRAR
jgi:hypothetical protein